MAQKLTMVYWKGERFWLGKLLQHPEIMTQGETLEELEGWIQHLTAPLERGYDMAGVW